MTWYYRNNLHLGDDEIPFFGSSKTRRVETTLHSLYLLTLLLNTSQTRTPMLQGYWNRSIEKGVKGKPTHFAVPPRNRRVGAHLRKAK